METARKLAPEADKVYYIGISKGASIGAVQAYRYPCIAGMLLVNPTLMINWLKIKRGLEFFSVDDAKRQALRMVSEGADIIDIGGESTRPGYIKISDEEDREL